MRKQTMKKVNENPIDQYFNEVLKSPDLKFNKQDWKGFEKLLPKKAKNRGIIWWIPASVAAAIVLLFTSIWLWQRPDITKYQLAKLPQKMQQRNLPGKITSPQNKQALIKMDSTIAGNKPGSAKILGQKGNNVTAYHDQNIFLGKRSPVSNFLNTEGKIARNTENYPNTFSPLPLQTLNSLQAEKKPLFYRLAIKNVPQIPAIPDEEKKAKESPASPDPHSRFSLAISLSPDINSVSHFSNSSFGTSFGLGASYRITANLSVNTGISYSKKVYNAEPYQYKAAWASIAANYDELIHADCRVLDVPINLNYRFLNSPKKTLFASAGVSSYFMLKENYTLVDKNSPAGSPAYPNPSYAYKNKNQHLLSILNLSAGVAKPISMQTSLVIEPYARIPLTGIGQGKVNLQSAGLNFQLHYKFGKKPGKKSTLISAVQ